MFLFANAFKFLVAILAFSVCATGQAAELIHKAYTVANLLSEDFDVDDLIATITCSICEEEWEDVGGPGFIEATDDNRILIDQSAEIHEVVRKFLDTLERFRTRAASDPPPKDKLQVMVSDGKVDKNKLQIVVYDVSQLLQAGSYDAAIQSITKMDVRTWNFVGGPASYNLYQPGDALVILQTPAVHKKVSRYLGVPQVGK